MLKKKIAVTICCFLFLIKTKAEEPSADSFTVIVTEDSAQVLLQGNENFSPNTVYQRVREKIEDNKKLVAAALAFPLPLGVVGAHRVYLGCKPYIPLVYITTVGGCFGILPLIDFVVILFTKKEDLGKFENNSKVFMWAK